MGVAGILHTGLTVSDLDRSIAFYRDLLGLELITQWDSSQPYLRTVVGYPDAELRIALLRLPERLGGGGPSPRAPRVPTAPGCPGRREHVQSRQWAHRLHGGGSRGDLCGAESQGCPLQVRAGRDQSRTKRGRQGRVPVRSRRHHAGAGPAGRTGMTSLDLFRLDGQTAVVIGGAGGSARRSRVAWPRRAPSYAWRT